MNNEEQEQEEEHGGLLNMSRGTEVGIATFFVSAPLLAGAAELLRLGLPGLTVGALAAGAIGFAGKHVLEKQGKRLPVVEGLRSANWGALLGTSYEENRETGADEVEEQDQGEETLRQPVQVTGAMLKRWIPRLINQNTTFLGIKRKGKSNALAILLMALAEEDFPILLMDTEGEYEELARAAHMPRGLLAGPESYARDVPEGIRFFAISKETAFDFAQHVLENCLQVVVCLKAWQDDEAAEIMAELILGCEEWQQARGIGQRIPFFLVIDELRKWIPQNTGESPLSPTALKLVQYALFDVVTARGGKRGYGFIGAAQKYSEVNKKIFQGPWRFLFAQSEQIELKQYAVWGVQQNASRLAPGECSIIGPFSEQPLLAQWPLCSIPLKGKSPTMENLRAHQQHIPRHLTETLSSMEMNLGSPRSRPTTPEMRAWSQVEENQRVVSQQYHQADEPVTRPPEQRAGFTPPIRETEPLPQMDEQVVPVPHASRTSRVDVQKNPTLKAALTFYQEGHTSHNALARKMDVSKGTAGKYIAQLKAMGEI